MALRSATANTVLLTANPKGNFLEGPIGDTSKPGTIMQIQGSTALIGNEATWVAAAPGADGAKVLPALLLEDRLQGKTITDAYVSGRKCFLYFLLPGDIFLALVGEVAGTGNSYEPGDRLIIDAEDGILVPEVGSTTIEDCFAICMEVSQQAAGSTLLMCMKT